jgi:hypothetical protein
MGLACSCLAIGNDSANPLLVERAVNQWPHRRLKDLQIAGPWSENAARNAERLGYDLACWRADNTLFTKHVQAGLDTIGDNGRILPHAERNCRAGGTNDPFAKARQFIVQEGSSPHYDADMIRAAGRTWIPSSVRCKGLAELDGLSVKACAATVFVVVCLAVLCIVCIKTLFHPI